MIKRLSLLLFILPFILPSAISAATIPQTPGQIFSVTPIILNADLIPGKTQTFSIGITNLLPSALGIHATIEAFKPDGEDDVITNNGHQDPLISWSILPNPDIIMNPREAKSVSLTITPSKTAKNGNYYELVFLTPIFDQHVSGTTPQVLSRVGVLISGTIGKPNYSFLRGETTISQIQLTKSQKQNELLATIHVQNNAAYQFDAKPIVIITPLLGAALSRWIQDKHVLPRTSRRFVAIFSLPTNHLFYHVQATVSVGNGERIEKDQWIFLQSTSMSRLLVATLLGLLAVCLFLGRKRLRKALYILTHKDS